jgi:DNA repair protein RadC
MPLTSINIYTLKQVKESTVQYCLDQHPITSPETCYNALQQILDLKSEPVEKFGIITLTSKNKIAGIHVLSTGTLDSAYIQPREVYQAALMNNAKSIIAWHNHPSGDPNPSQADISLTTLLKYAGTVLRIKLLDHIIIGNDKFVSLKERMLL